MSAPPSSRSVEEAAGYLEEALRCATWAGFIYDHRTEALSALADLRALAERGQRIEEAARQLIRRDIDLEAVREAEVKLIALLLSPSVPAREREEQ